MPMDEETKQKFKDTWLEMSDEQRRVRSLEDRLVRLENRFNARFPEDYNCPKCGKKVPKGARNCPLCSHKW